MDLVPRQKEESLKSKEESKEITDKIEYINNNKLIFQGEITLFKKKHYTPETYKKLSDYTQLSNILKEEEKNISQEKLQNLNSKIKEHKQNKFFDLKLNIETGQISMKNTDVKGTLSQMTQRWNDTNLRYLTNQNIDSIINDIGKAENIGFTTDLELITGFGGQAVLKDFGYEFSDKGFFFTVNEAIKENYKITQTTKEDIGFLASEIKNYINQNLHMEYIQGSKAIRIEHPETKYWVNLGKDKEKAETIANLMDYSKDKLRHNQNFGYSINKPQTKAEISIITGRLKQYEQENKQKLTINVKETD